MYCYTVHIIQYNIRSEETYIFVPLIFLKRFGIKLKESIPVGTWLQDAIQNSNSEPILKKYGKCIPRLYMTCCK